MSSFPQARWHELTDRYAAAVAAFQRGDAAAREQLRAAYNELRHLTRSEGLPFPENGD
ncbi:hypothetical protein [Variovorax sp. ZT4R33]|uniref:hypothetical protein n=1 Tax=Variovorax sp. ZT4R33 TaxID=3443743 RepID=UPI003F48C09E